MSTALAAPGQVPPGLMQLSAGGLGPALPFGREIPCLDTHIAGTTHSQAAAMQDRLLPGAVLVPRREPDNAADPRAVALYAGDVRVGFLPQKRNEVVSRLMDAGKLFVVRVQAAALKGNWLEVRVQVALREV